MGGGCQTDERKMLLFLNESCPLSKATLSGKGRQGEEVNALCQDWQATEPRAINSERGKAFPPCKCHIKLLLFYLVGGREKPISAILPKVCRELQMDSQKATRIGLASGDWGGGV